MCAMSEAAFRYRSLYLLCTRSEDMARTLMLNAEDMGDRSQARRLADEVCELTIEANRWRIKWQEAGGYRLAPIVANLPLRQITLDMPGTFDMSNVIMFPTQERSDYAC